MLKWILRLLIFLFLAFTQMEVSAQCAMCRRVAESNRETNENKIGNHLNFGILYLLAMPYLIGAIGTFVWMKNRKKD